MKRTVIINDSEGTWKYWYYEDKITAIKRLKDRKDYLNDTIQHRSEAETDTGSN